jgi:Leucine-rich repeat (LRR) protein
VSKLDLSYNKIAHLRKGSFDGLLLLDEVDLSSNSLRRIGLQDFRNVKYLKKLTFEYNYLDTNNLLKFTQIESIDLSFNRLNSTEILNNILGIEQTKTIELIRNQITEISQVRQNFQSLDELFLGYNLIKVVKNESFSKLSCLKRLHLDNNRIERIESGSFVFLTELNYLNLAHNLLSKLESSYFNELENLRFIDLINNFFKSFDNSFYIASEFLALSLSSNLINELKICAKISSFKLSLLTLKSNSIADIPPSSFSCFDSLFNLDLSFYSLKLIKSEYFTYGLTPNKLSLLNKLYLNNNNIERIEARSFEALSLLVQLDLSHNWIREVDFVDLIQLDSLKTLKLNDNNLSRVEANLLSSEMKVNNNLQELDLSNNQIEHINFELFVYVVNLEKLNLDNNRLETINLESNSTLPLLQRLKYLSLKNNRLKYLPTKELGELRAIEHIDLNNNNLVQLNLSIFDNLINLQYLQLSNIRLIGSMNVDSLYKVESLDLSK